MSEEVDVIEEPVVQDAEATPVDEPIDNTPDASLEAPATPEVEDTSAEVEPEIDPEVDWEKRYNDLNQYTGGMSSEIHRLKEVNTQYSGLGEFQDVQKRLNSYNQITERQSLKPWNRDHADYSNFNSTRDKARTLGAMVNNLEGEDRQSMQRQIETQFSQDEIASLQQWQRHSEDTQQRLAEDPERFIQDIVRGQIENQFSDYEQYQSVRQNTSQFIGDNQELIDNHGDTFQRVLSDQTPRREVALELVKAQAELEKLRAELGQSMESSAQADAQTHALKNNATVKRDLKTESIYQDPVALADEKGLKGQAKMRFLNEYNKKHNKG